MHLAYWIIASLLAALYAFAGITKIVRSQEQLAPTMGWVDTIPMPVVRAIGVLEIFGAVGLILPPLTGVAPGLAVAAAAGFLVLQVLAAGVHLTRSETKDIGMNVALIVLAGVAVWLATSF